VKRVWLVLATVLVVLGTIGVMALTYGDKRQLREVVLERALRSHLEGQPRFAPNITTGDTLRGVSYEQANVMLTSCASVEDWTFLGEEQRGAHDCQLQAIFSCKRPEGSLIARIFAESEPGDRIGKLAAWSDFLACSTGLCPDFETGEPRTDGVHTCETAYKVRPVGESIVRP
jgi:hypothetical protein